MHDWFLCILGVFSPRNGSEDDNLNNFSTAAVSSSLGNCVITYGAGTNILNGPWTDTSKDRIIVHLVSGWLFNLQLAFCPALNQHYVRVYVRSSQTWTPWSQL